MTEARVTLHFGELKYNIPPSAQTDIPEGFNEAEVHQGLWIFYDQTSYDVNKDVSKIVREGQGKVSLGFNARSCREVDYKSDGIVLFEHHHYYGKMETFTESEPKIEGFHSGVSSMIILPASEWDLYIEPDFKGAHATKPTGDYPTPQSMGLPNDSVKSIRRA